MATLQDIYDRLNQLFPQNADFGGQSILNRVSNMATIEGITGGYGLTNMSGKASNNAIASQSFRDTLAAISPNADDYVARILDGFVPGNSNGVSRRMDDPYFDGWPRDVVLDEFESNITSKSGYYYPAIFGHSPELNAEGSGLFAGWSIDGTSGLDQDGAFNAACGVLLNYIRMFEEFSSLFTTLTNYITSIETLVSQLENDVSMLGSGGGNYVPGSLLSQLGEWGNKSIHDTIEERLTIKYPDQFEQLIGDFLSETSHITDGKEWSTLEKMFVEDGNCGIVTIADGTKGIIYDDSNEGITAALVTLVSIAKRRWIGDQYTCPE